MREPGQHGPHTDIYWIGHGTVLLRAAPEHIKPATPIQDTTEKARDPLDAAKQALANIRQRGVTQYIDLGKSNKRRREEVATDEEEDDSDQTMSHFPGDQLPPDRWQVSDDGRMWTRIHSNPRRKLYVPEITADVESPIQSTSESETNGGCQMAIESCTTFGQALRPSSSTRPASPTTSTALALHFLKTIDILMMTNIMKNHINLKNLNKNLGATLPLRRAQMTP